MVDGFLNKYVNTEMIKLEMCMSDGRASSFNETKNESFKFFVNYLNVKEYYTNNKTKIMSSHLPFYPRITYCGYFMNSGSCIDANGNLMSCPKKFDVNKYAAGNIRDEKININNEIRFYNEWYEPMLKCCGDCFAYYYCGSGCPTEIARNSDGSYKNDDCRRLCDLKKYFYSKIVNQIINGDPPKWIDVKPLINYSSPEVNVVSFREKANMQVNNGIKH